MLGEFELLVLLSILQRRGGRYANEVRADLMTRGGRTVSRGALYRTLDRLRDKDLVRWELEPSAKPERGGHPMRRLKVTPEGRAAVSASRTVIMRFFSALESTQD